MSVSLKTIVDVDVQISKPSAISSSFNLGLIIGTTKPTDATPIHIYNSSTYSTEMVSDGYATTSAEYKAVQIYFSQGNYPDKVAVGYYDAAADSTPAACVTKLRGLNGQFYGFCFVSELTEPQITAIAAAVEAFDIPTVFYFASSDDKAVTSGSSSVFDTLKTSSYKRTFGFYGKDANLAAGVLGVASSMNTMKDNSAYTLAYKTITGVTADNLTDAQISILTEKNGNAYCVFGNTYSFIYPAISSGGYHVDEVFLIDVAKHLIQLSTVEGLTSSRVIPQTEDGVNKLISYISNACQTMASMGIISSGIWRGGELKALNNGDAVQNRYFIQSDSMASQSAEDRAKRISPPIYVALVATGAIEHVVINVVISR